ncbi:MAG: hypothetical protein KBT35_01345 [Firmicutes bacterium]|nr:hypothetical protein [Candidatus Colivicinus equi]
MNKEYQEALTTLYEGTLGKEKSCDIEKAYQLLQKCIDESKEAIDQYKGALKQSCTYLSHYKISITECCNNVREYKTVEELEEYFLKNWNINYVCTTNNHEENLSELILKLLSYPKEEWIKAMKGAIDENL